MFQNPRLLPWLTVLENVEVVLSKEQRDSDRATEILSIMGLKKVSWLLSRPIIWRYAKRELL